MKIKIIDLLNKIANNEELPKKLKYDGNIYFLESDAIYEFFTYKTIDYDKFNIDGKRIGKALFLDNCYMHLYSEIEIIEEDKKIENFYFSVYQDQKLGGRDVVQNLEKKINELIYEVNKLKEK